MKGQSGNKGVPGSTAAVYSNLLKVYSAIAEELSQVENLYTETVESGGDFEIFKKIPEYSGKKVRAALLLFLAKGNGELVTNSHIAQAASIELVHTATLLHDDVLDETDVRRNRPSFKSEYDNEFSIISGDYLFTKALALVCTLGNNAITSELIRACDTICLGEIKQLQNKHNYGLSTEDYIDIVTKKTATLFELAAYWGCPSDKDQKKFALFGRKAGILFQVVDDWIDLSGDEERAGKSVLQDVKKGKLTLPMIYLRKEIGAKKLQDVFHYLNSSENHKADYIRERFRENNVGASVKQFVGDLRDESLDILRQLGLNDEQKDSVCDLLDFLSRRDF